MTKWPAGKPIIARGADGKPKMPPPAKLVINAAKAVARNTQHVMQHGTLQISKDEQARRRAICEACQWYHDTKNRCGHPECGCFYRMKTWLAAERCPDNQW